MSLIPRLYSAAHRFVGRSLRRDCLDRLPNDIIVDVVFDYLDVFDIVRMRMVSKLYYELTHVTVLWKRLLRRIDIPLPPVPLAPKRTMAKITGLEAERLVIRAHSLSTNWKKHNPKVLREWCFDAQRRVLAMALLPGGDYMIASVANHAQSQYSLVVFSMNHPGAPRAISAVDTSTKAYSIQAKYMNIKNQCTIVIAYLSRDYLRPRDREKAALGRLPDVSHYSTYHDVDPEIRFKYECTTMHLSLQNLEALSGIPYSPESPEFKNAAKQLPPPFTNLFSISSRSPLTSPVLSNMYGSAYLAVVKGANDIVFKRLEGGAAATLTCVAEPVVAQWNHTIKAIQLLPQEHAVMVVRQVDVPLSPEQPHPIYLFETYRALRSDRTAVVRVQQSEQCMIHRRLGHLTHIYLPEYPALAHLSDLVNDEQRPPPLDPYKSPSSPHMREPTPPPPICMVAHRANEEAFVRVLFVPQRFELELPPTPPSADAPNARSAASGGGGRHMTTRRKHVMYRTALERNQSWVRPMSDYNVHLRVIPGVVRPLCYTVPWDDVTDAPRVLAVRPLIDRGWEVLPVLEHGVMRHAEGWIGCPAFEGGLDELDMHVSAFAWDETIGRLLVAEEGSNEIIVYDFAATPRLDYNKQRYPIPLRDIPDTNMAMSL